MNMYRVRMIRRREIARQESLAQSATVAIDAERVIRDYETAYRELYGALPKVAYKRGWYKINGKTNCRRSDLIQMTGLLQAQLHEQEIDDGN